MNYKIYNKSSENMSEIETGSVDLIIAGPPYNIGTIYGNNQDILPFSSYKNMVRSVCNECHRVLKQEGVILVEASDTILSGGLYIQLAALVQSTFLDAGFYLQTRHINFVNTQRGVELKEDDRWSDDYSTKNNAHSNCHQWIVFAKKQTTFENGNIFYLNYEEASEHPCPFPQKICDLFLSKYYTEGMTVLDPFMGTANLGKSVIGKGGRYIGYEIDTTIFSEAKNKLSKIINKN